MNLEDQITVIRTELEHKLEKLNILVEELKAREERLKKIEKEAEQ